ncbi:hypothetical protein J1614_004669 [Plenodomus biglobosus]|nr:hypothetical protein J1614_004669 [Plenodomus biglobosus]
MDAIPGAAALLGLTSPPWPRSGSKDRPQCTADRPFQETPEDASSRAAEACKLAGHHHHHHTAPHRTALVSDCTAPLCLPGAAERNNLGPCHSGGGDSYWRQQGNYLPN